MTIINLEHWLPVLFVLGLATAVILTGLYLARGELTGRRVLFSVTGFFGVIIAVNLVLAHRAVGTFPGVETRNPYISSQTFDADRRAQQELGWDLAHAYDPDAGTLSLTFTDTDTGYPSEVAALSVLVGRTTQAASDTRPEFLRDSGSFIAPLDLAPGKWLLRIEAEARDGTLFRQRLNLLVKG